ncbi:integrator complex subunit 3 homolog isoform X2 [Varroa jacobsoni]|uniref:integrator complex subunit 3 homolog isoform X2 n=1 Tax=Varroa jacobsoni TaxID=62625 RepID=UPI000BF81E93|nr:integrator complex subunit 3 homolog isoform X2 [Varroa jacobsoni]
MFSPHADLLVVRQTGLEIMEISNSKTAPHNYQAANQSQQQQQQQQQQPQQQAQQPQHRKQPSLARGRRNRYPPRSIPGRNTTEARPPARSSNGYGQGQSGQDGSPGPTNKLPANTFSAASPPLPPTTNAATESRETSPSPSTPPPTDQKTEHIKYAAEAALENFIAHLEALMLCPPAPWRGDILSAVLSEHLCLISSCSRNIHPIDNRIHHAARKLSMLKQSGNLHLILPIVPPPVDTAYRPYPAPMANPPTTTYQDNLTTPSSPTVSRPPQDQSDPALREFADPASSDQAIHGPPEQFQIPQRQPVGPQPNPSPHLPQGHLPVPNHSPAIQDPIIGTAPATPVQMTSLPDIDQHHSTMPHLCKSASRWDSNNAAPNSRWRCLPCTGVLRMSTWQLQHPTCCADDVVRFLVHRGLSASARAKWRHRCFNRTEWQSTSASWS